MRETTYKCKPNCQASPLHPYITQMYMLFFKFTQIYLKKLSKNTNTRKTYPKMKRFTRARLVMLITLTMSCLLLTTAKDLELRLDCTARSVVPEGRQGQPSSVQQFSL